MTAMLWYTQQETDKSDVYLSSCK